MTTFLLVPGGGSDPSVRAHAVVTLIKPAQALKKLNVGFRHTVEERLVRQGTVAHIQ